MLNVIRTPLLALALLSTLHAQKVVIRTSTLLDGKGETIRNASIVLDGSTIAEVRRDGKAPRPDYDLTGLTVMPGWIDTHVHMAWYIDRNGKAQLGGDSPVDVLYGAGNAWQT